MANATTTRPPQRRSTALPPPEPFRSHGRPGSGSYSRPYGGNGSGGYSAPAKPLEPLGQAQVQALTVGPNIIGPGTGFLDTYDGVLNPYSGCTFGCDYCYASQFQKSAARVNAWGKYVDVKANAARRIAEYPAGLWNGKSVYMSSVTDPYQPIEGREKVTRAVLEGLAARHPRIKLVVQTRAPLAVRDLDLYQELLARGGRVQVNYTLTSEDETARRLFEPGCPSLPARRKAAARFAAAGIPTCFTLTPLLPVLDIQELIRQIQEAGVSKVIVQPFKMPVEAANQAGGMQAKTDRKALARCVEWYGGDAQSAAREYRREYAANLKALQAAFPRLGQGKDGFRPPF